MADEDSNLVQHAIRELALIDNDQWFNDSIINAVREFAKGGHSGGSAPIASAMLYDLLQYKPLTPLTDDPDEWMLIDEEVAGRPDLWQSKRDPAAFSNDGGKTYTLVSEKSGPHPPLVHKSKERT